MGPLMLGKGQLEVEARRNRRASLTSEMTVWRREIYYEDCGEHRVGPIELSMMSVKIDVFVLDWEGALL